MDLVPVTDLKQWAYCPRVVYYHRVMPAPPRPTGIVVSPSIEKPKGARRLGEKDFAGYLLIYFKDQTQSAYLAISRDGYTFTDINEGAPVFDGTLLAEQKGVVYYYREVAQGEPPPQATEVIKAIIGARLPVRLSSRPDYSNAIGFDGKPIQ